MTWRWWLSIATALLALPVPAPAGSGAAACRCAQLTLDRYFAQAEIVLVGRAARVERIESGGADRLDVEFEPVFRPHGFKGSIEGLVFATPLSSASCGVDVRAGETYVVFATRDGADPRRAWFTTCSGSRMYAGGPHAGEVEPFAGMEVNRIVPRLFELADGVAAPETLHVPDFHTSPACWSEPRIVHVGAVDVERPDRLRIAAAGARQVSPTWISEKLAFVRIVWGRVLVRSLAYLDGDWDGRVFTEAGGRAYTVSAQKGALGREEYPADILEIREVAGGMWLRVALYRVSRCIDSDASPVHAGWVPAFSEAGRAVASTWPRGY